MAYEMILSPIKIGTMTVKNRMVMTAAEMSMGDMDGRATEKLISYYEERAKGGVGMIITATTRVNDWDSASTFNQLAASHDYHIESLRKFADRIHSHGAKLCVQLHHAGRQGYAISTNALPMLIPASKAVPQVKKLVFKSTDFLYRLEQKGLYFPVKAPSVCEPSYHVPSKMVAMSKKHIKKLISDFIDAAERCKKAGVDAVEIHSAHGYLIEQFLSPNTNHRTDEYGGSFENRMRFLLEIIAGIRQRCGDYPIIVRLTVDEMYERIGQPGKGYTLEDGKLMAKRLEQAGVDAINVTCACYDTYNYWLEPTSFKPGWRAYLAKEVKSVVSIPVIAANLVRSPQQAEQQLEEGVQDFIGSARSFFCDPYWVKKVEDGHPELIKRCIGCLNCMESMTHNTFRGTNGECALNPYLGQETKKLIRTDGDGRLVIVVGAGVAGLMAAETLARRGFKVKVYDKNKKPGGQVITASTCLHKDKLYWSVEDLMANVKALGVSIKLGTEMTADSIVSENPYAVILATGAVPVVPKSISGTDLPNVCVAPDIIMGKRKIENRRVVVVGSGMTGLETTEVLNQDGNQVTVIEMAKEVAPGTWFQLLDDEMSRIKGHGTVFITGKRLMAIKEDKVIVEDVDSCRLEEIPADAVVLSLGVRGERALYEQLKDRLGKVYLVGDANGGGRIATAVHDGFKAAINV